ncbi:hypothetical protein LCGC14_1880990 [marine sediment metagenome]|uniref:Uncharacterized protein n=1 Tax=marine sediment metagenome TaxID=412755 RepID=A0A0F9G2A9_9ZZZZ
MKKKTSKKKFRVKKKDIKSKSAPKSKHRVKNTKAKKSDKKKKSKSKKGYQRGDLGRAIFALFDKVGVDKVTFTQAVKVAKAAKPDTTYEKSYFGWHKNHYRNERDL